MRYKKLQTIKEQQTGCLVDGDRSTIAALIRSTQCRADRREILRRLYWIGYPMTDRCVDRMYAETLNGSQLIG